MGYNSQAAGHFDLKRVLALVAELERAHDIPQWRYLCAPEKMDKPPFLLILAEALNAPLILCDRAMLERQAAHCLSRSLRSLALYGCGSVAEAASLCGAGDKAELLIPRVKFDFLTFAIARS